MKNARSSSRGSSNSLGRGLQAASRSALAPLTAMALLLGPAARAQHPETDKLADDLKVVESFGQGRHEDRASASEEAEEKKEVSWVALPVLVADPTVGEGLAVVAMALYEVGVDTQPSSTGVAGMYASSESKVGAVFQTLHSSHDRWRVTALAAAFDLNLEFYGIGQDPGEATQSVPTNHEGWTASVSVMRKVKGNFYLGLKYGFLSNLSTVDASSGTPSGTEVPLELDLQMTPLALQAEIDSRDSKFEPIAGQHFEAAISATSSNLGGDVSYEKYTAKYNRYLETTANSVLAVRGTACAIEGNAPFYGLCLVGVDDGIRGYAGGQYRDHASVSAQAEFRHWPFKRVGYVVFAGGALVADSVGDLAFDRWLPSLGVGIRVMMPTEHKVSVGIDYAKGDDSEAVYFRVGQAF